MAAAESRVLVGDGDSESGARPRVGIEQSSGGLPGGDPTVVTIGGPVDG